MVRRRGWIGTFLATAALGLAGPAASQAATATFQGLAPGEIYVTYQADPGETNHLTADLASLQGGLVWSFTDTGSGAGPGGSVPIALDTSLAPGVSCSYSQGQRRATCALPALTLTTWTDIFSVDGNDSITITGVDGGNADGYDGGTGSDTFVGGAETDIVTPGLLGGDYHGNAPGAAPAGSDQIDFTRAEWMDTAINVSLDDIANDGPVTGPTMNVRSDFAGMLTGNGNDVIDASSAPSLQCPAINQCVGRSIYSGAGDDTITGSAFNDYIAPGDGNDVINAGDGSDLMLLGQRSQSSHKSVSGGPGYDYVLYTGLPFPVSLHPGASPASPADTDQFPSGDVENYQLTDNADTFDASQFASANTATTSAGVTVYSLKGNDTLIGSQYADVFTIQSGTKDLSGGPGYDYVAVDRADGVNISLDNVANDGSAGENSNIHADIESLQGGAGNDTFTDLGLNAANGAQSGYSTVLFGGPGDDTLVGHSSAAAGTALYGGPGNDTLADHGTGVYSASGDDGTDTITSDAATNAVIIGGGGDDTLANGAGGATFVEGSDPGSDAISSVGPGTVDYSGATTGVSVTLDGIANDGPAGSRTNITGNIVGIAGGPGSDRLVGDPGAQTIVGGAGNDAIDGGGGNDVLDGGTGENTLSLASRTAAATVSLLNGTLVEPGGNTKLANIQDVVGGAGNDHLTGDGGANVISGGPGDDTIVGNGGDDHLYGGDGTDTTVGGPGTDVCSDPDPSCETITTEQNVLASVSTSGLPTSAGVTAADATPDGALIAFASASADLVAGDTNGATDVFVRNVVTGTTERVSVSTDRLQGNGNSGADGARAFPVSISDNGRYVVFTSVATNLGTASNGAADQVFVRDRVDQTTTPLLTDTGGLPNGSVYDARISGDGRVVVFTSTARNLIAGTTTDGLAHTYVRDLTKAANAILKVDGDGGTEDTGGGCPASISRDGSAIVFTYDGTAGVSPGVEIVGANGSLNVVSSGIPSATGFQELQQACSTGAVSDDGRFIIFQSNVGPDGLPLSGANPTSTFLYDRDSDGNGTFDDYLGTRATFVGAGSGVASLSADGRQVAYEHDPNASDVGQWSVWDRYLGSAVPAFATAAGQPISDSIAVSGAAGFVSPSTFLTISGDPRLGAGALGAAPNQVFRSEIAAASLAGWIGRSSLGRPAVVLAAADGSRSVVVPGTDWASDVSIAPGSGSLAYTMYGPGLSEGARSIHVSDPDGTRQRAIPKPASYPVGWPNVTTYMDDFGVRWSPDGASLAFSRQDGAVSSIVVAPADGAGPGSIVLPGYTSNAVYAASDAVWSPDGTRIAATATDKAGTTSAAYTVAATGGAPSPLTPAPSTTCAGGLRMNDWSTGDVVAFTTLCGIVRVRSAAGVSSDVATGAADGRFSPDGTRLMFTRILAAPSVWSSSLDGTGLVQVSPAGAPAAGPGYGPERAAVATASLGAPSTTVAGSAPVPIGNIPYSAVPTRSDLIPGAAIGSMNLATSALGAAPLLDFVDSDLMRRTSLATIPITVPTGPTTTVGWDAVLAASRPASGVQSLAKRAPQDVTVGQVLADPGSSARLAALNPTLAQTQVAGSPLAGISPLAAFFSGDLLETLPLAPDTLASGRTTILDGWCAAIVVAGGDCAALGIDPTTPGRDISFGSLAASGIDAVKIPVSSIAWGNVGSAPRSTPGGPRSTPGGPRSTPGGPRSTPGGPRSTPGGPRSTPGGPRSTPGGPRSTPGGGLAFWDVFIASNANATIGKLPLASFLTARSDMGTIPASWIPASIATCTGCQTLEQMTLNPGQTPTLNDLLNALPPGTVRLDNLLWDLPAAPAVSLDDVLAMIDPVAITYMSAEEIVSIIIDPATFKWENLPLDDMHAQQYATGAAKVTYSLSLARTGSDPVAAATATVTLPPTFTYVAGSARRTSGSPVDDPTVTESVNGQVLSFFVGNLRSGVGDQLQLDAFAGYTVGASTASAAVTVYQGPSGAAQPLPIVVTPPAPAVAPADLVVNTLYLGYIRNPGDTVSYRIPIPAIHGTHVYVRLSHLATDSDLVVYSQAGSNVRALPIVPANDQLPLPDVSASSGQASTTSLPPNTANDVPITPGLPVKGISANRGSVDETVDATSAATDAASGYFTIQVSGYNGTISASPFVVRVQETPPATLPGCATRTVAYPFTGTVQTMPSLPTGLNTVMLVNYRRLRETYGQSAADKVWQQLQVDFVTNQQPGVVAAVIPVESDAATAAAYTAWDAALCQPDAANGVATAVARQVDAIRAARPTLRNVVIVGGDDQIPQFRLPDPTQDFNETGYWGTFADKVSQYYGSTFSGDMLSDDPYGATSSTPILDRQLYTPTLAVGRLVESPADIIAQADQFASASGRLDPTTAAVAGYGFMADGATAAGQALVTSRYSTTSQTTASWTTSDLLGLMFPTGTTPDILGLNAHADHFEFESSSAAAGAADPVLDTSTIPAGANLSRRIIFTMGCHAGLSVADNAVASFPTDWAQTLLGRKAAVYLANTGYGYGDTTTVGYSEALMADFAANLNGTMTIGDAVAQAKQTYRAGLQAIATYDEKSMQESTLYGFPMWHIGATLPTGPTGSAGHVATPDPAAGLPAYAFTVTPSFVSNTPAAGTGTFLTDGTTTPLVQANRPIQPRTIVDITSADPTRTAHGVWIRSLTSSPSFTVDPAWSRPIVGSSTTEPEAAFANAFYPSQLQSLTSSQLPGAAPRLQQSAILVDAQYSSGSSPTAGGEREFASIGASALYSGSSDAIAPTILQTQSSLVGGGVAFDVVVNDSTGPTDVQRVAVLYLDGADGAWTYAPLTKSAVSNIWTGGGAYSGTGNPTFFVEAQDAAGNVGVSSNKGSLYVAAPPPAEQPPGPGQGRLSISTSWVNPTVNVNGWITGGVTVALADTNPAATLSLSVDGAPPVPYAPPVVVGGTGVHTIRATASDGGTQTTVVAIDEAPPIVTIDAPVANTAVKAGTPVVLKVRCTDAGSGLDASGCAGTVTSAALGAPLAVVDGSTLPTAKEGTYTITINAQDRAGNAQMATSTYYVDSTAPTITITVPANGATIALGSATFAVFECRDMALGDMTFGSGEAVSQTCVGTITMAGSSTVTTVAPGAAIPTTTAGTYTLTVVGTDAAGNAGTAVSKYTVASLSGDHSPPRVTITTPGRHARYTIRTVVRAAYACADASGVRSCTGTVASGAAIDTATVGLKSFSVTATDKVGNTVTVTRWYLVLPERPVDPEVDCETPRAGGGFIVWFSYNNPNTRTSTVAGGSSNVATGGTVSNLPTTFQVGHVTRAFSITIPQAGLARWVLGARRGQGSGETRRC